jgi:hypothetical protein
MSKQTKKQTEKERLNKMKEWREAHPGYKKHWDEAHPGYNKERKKQEKENDPELRLYSKVWHRENQELGKRFKKESVGEDIKTFKAEQRKVPPYKKPTDRFLTPWKTLSTKQKSTFVNKFYAEGMEEFEKIMAEKNTSDEKLLSRIDDDAPSTMTKATTPKKGAKRPRSEPEQENSAGPIAAIEEEERPIKKQKTEEPSYEEELLEEGAIFSQTPSSVVSQFSALVADNVSLPLPPTQGPGIYPGFAWSSYIEGLRATQPAPVATLAIPAQNLQENPMVEKKRFSFQDQIRAEQVRCRKILQAHNH